MSRYGRKKIKRTDIEFRCSHYEKLKWQTIAQSKGESLSSWIRSKLNGNRDRGSADRESIDLYSEIGRAIALIKSEKEEDAIAHLNSIRLKLIGIKKDAG